VTDRICECAGQYGGSTHVGNDDLERCDLCGLPINARWRARLVIAWYDAWVGVFWDRKSRKLYILPLPCVGVVLNFGDNP